ncbi:MAG: hypothetical protein ACM3WV_03030 [Bacillota bacterium]
MPKQELMDAVEAFRKKLETARQGGNIAQDVVKAVGELLKDLGIEDKKTKTA